MKSSLVFLTLISSVLTFNNEITRPIHSTYVTVVNVSVTISKMKILDYLNMEVEYELELQTMWLDSRLGPDDVTQRKATTKQIWNPKVIFTSGIVTFLPNDLSQYWRGWGMGNVMYSERYILKTGCSTNFQPFPFDRQRCLIKISSYRFPRDEVLLKWNNINALQIKDTKNIKLFSLTDFFTFTENEIRSSGNFSVLIVELLLVRQIHNLIIMEAIASITFVLLAYLSFWIHFDEYKIRIFISLTSLIGIILLHNYITYNVPQTSYFKIIDTWTIMCSFYTFIPLIQTVLLITMTTSYKNKTEHCVEDIEAETRISSKKVDCLFRVVHPVLFLTCASLFITLCLL